MAGVAIRAPSYQLDLNVVIVGHYDAHYSVDGVAEADVYFDGVVHQNDQNFMVTETSIGYKLVSFAGSNVYENDFTCRMRFSAAPDTTYGIGVKVKTYAAVAGAGICFMDAGGNEGIWYDSITVYSERALLYEDWSNPEAYKTWYKDRSGGLVDPVAAVGSYTPPCYVISKTQSAGGASMWHFFEPQLGMCVAQARLKVNTGSPQSSFCLRSDFNELCCNGAFIKYGSSVYFCLHYGGTWYTYKKCLLNTWYTITYVVNCPARTYDLYIDGQRLTGVSGSPFDAGSYVSNVFFQSASVGSGSGSSMWVDDVTVRTGTLLYIDEFQDGKISDWVVVNKGGPVKVDTTSNQGGYQKPALKLQKATVSGGTSARRYVTSQSSHMFVELKIMVSTLNPWNYVCLRGGDSFQVYFALKDSYFSWYDAIGGSGAWHNVAPCTAWNWYRLSFDVDIANGHFNVMIEDADLSGSVLYSGSGDLCPGSHYIDNLYIQAGWYDLGSGNSVWIDDVIMTN